MITLEATPNWTPKSPADDRTYRPATIRDYHAIDDLGIFGDDNLKSDRPLHVWRQLLAGSDHVIRV